MNNLRIPLNKLLKQLFITHMWEVSMGGSHITPPPPAEIDA
jgi:hypothetical protein